MKYFLDCEFIENGETIDLLSIALVCEDGREFYRQNSDAKFDKASDWVWRNVYPHLQHFDMRGHRSCTEKSYCTGETHTGKCYHNDCPWRSHSQIRDEIKAFIDIEKNGKPEIWGYYSAYDWVAFCQLFGSMIDLPKGYPMFCRDIIQECKRLGNPDLPKLEAGEHSALNDARWNKTAYEFLVEHEKTVGGHVNCIKQLDWENQRGELEALKKALEAKDDGLLAARRVMEFHDWHKCSDHDSLEYRAKMAVENALHPGVKFETA